MGQTHHLCHRRKTGNRQQPRGKRHAARRPGTQKLPLCRFARIRSTRRHDLFAPLMLQGCLGRTGCLLLRPVPKTARLSRQQNPPVALLLLEKRVGVLARTVTLQLLPSSL